jgi:peptide/nickel transport system substrate-binding protein
VKKLSQTIGLLGALALGACGGGQSVEAPSSTLTVARVKDAVGLDPAHETDGLSLNVTSEMFQNLVRFKPGTFDVVADVAERWRSSPDGRVWTFTLARNQKFSDGSPLDASAVKFNFDRWRDSKNPYRGNFPYGYYASQFGGFDDKSVIAGVEAPAPTTVVIKLRTPFGPFLRDIAMPSFGIGAPDAIKADNQGFGLHPVASGPYVLGEWVKDDHITLRANPGWTRQKIAYTTVIVRDIPDQSTGVLSIKKGDVDMLVDPRPEDARQLDDVQGLNVYHPASNNVLYLALNMDKKPFDNLLVRRAIAYSIDEEALASGFWTIGSNVVGATVAANWTPPGMLGENRALKPYPHDVKQARALLAQGGFPHGFATQLYYPTSPRPYMPEPQRIAEALQSYLKDAGIDVTLQPFEFGVFLSKVRNGEHPMCLIGWTGDNGDPDDFMYDLLDQDSAVKGQAQNFSFWRDPAFHTLMLAGQRTIDDKQRAKIYERANAMIHDQVPAVPLVHSVVTFVADSSIRGVIARPDDVINFELLKPKVQP